MVGYNGYDATHAYTVHALGSVHAFRNMRAALAFCIMNRLQKPISYVLWDWSRGTVG